ncbi:FAD-dependent oxidoreductase [Brunnivagina elsteri]|uniref:FAD-dependent oxidoreductase n=1 Tax=Brunnivagina elsteri CCALA 953 TaxID=987040 RepID=A0A2A2TAS9_9CYAN|nr:FAD-dependent oxidoreductase [Calothrix elsteri]PAX47906.1 FAD-dependent oxidoreductase [Calothrix elsteri CCALA 953]
MSLTEDILSQLPGDILGGLRRADAVLASLRTGSVPVPEVVKENSQPLGDVEWDVVICGGTLGILIAAALACRGIRVALLERGILRGREQEWNISRHELGVFVELGLLSEGELENAIATEYNPARVAFHEGTEVWVEDVLNIGVNPVYLLETLKQKFLAADGKLFENTPFNAAVVHPDGVIINNQFKTRLLIDAMGHFSPITQQARNGDIPDALCLVVGTCASGFPENRSGDLLLSNTSLQNQCQYFWEAFPAKDGRTTYMFTYMDANPQRLNLEALFEDYLHLMPDYQGVELNQLDIKRALFGFFPSYRQSPLQTPWNRIITAGDSSGSQSPLSFGGFGAMVRHLKRLSLGVYEALQADELSVKALSLLQPYQPNLTVTWLFQKAMSVSGNQQIHPQQINQLLSAVFMEMQKLGEPVLKPFLQDVIQFSGLTQTLFKTGLLHPIEVIKVVPQVGSIALLDWTIHYINLGIYSVLSSFSPALEPWIKNMSASQQYYWHRWIDSWKYGSGGDYL